MWHEIWQLIANNLEALIAHTILFHVTMILIGLAIIWTINIWVQNRKLNKLRTVYGSEPSPEEIAYEHSPFTAYLSLWFICLVTTFFAGYEIWTALGVEIFSLYLILYTLLFFVTLPATIKLSILVYYEFSWIWYKYRT